MINDQIRHMCKARRLKRAKSKISSSLEFACNILDNRRCFLKILGLASLLLSSTANLANHHIQPGLWEVTTKSDLLALVPHIPSQHMQQFGSFAKQYGIQLPKIQNGAALSSLCITQEMAQLEIPAYFFESQSGCAIQNAVRTGNSYKMDIVCTNGQFQGNGSATGTFINPQSFIGSTEFDSTINHNPVFASAEINGRWIGDQCTVAYPPQ